MDAATTARMSDPDRPPGSDAQAGASAGPLLRMHVRLALELAQRRRREDRFHYLLEVRPRPTFRPSITAGKEPR